MVSYSVNSDFCIHSDETSFWKLSLLPPHPPPQVKCPSGMVLPTHNIM